MTRRGLACNGCGKDYGGGGDVDRPRQTITCRGRGRTLSGV